MTRFLLRLLEFYSGERYVRVSLLRDAYESPSLDPQWLRTVNAAIDYARIHER